MNNNAPHTFHDLEYSGIPDDFSEAIANLEILWNDFSSKIMRSLEIKVKKWTGSKDFESDAIDALREFVGYGENIGIKFWNKLELDDFMSYMLFIRSEWGKLDWMKRWKSFMFSGMEKEFFNKFKWIRLIQRETYWQREWTKNKIIPTILSI